jgi:hypothetical protein
VFPVLARHPPALEGVRFQLLEAVLLSRLSQVHPEFHEQDPVVRQGLLERVDLFELRLELGVRRLAVHAVEQRVRVPGAQKQPEVAAGREIPPEAPVRRTCSLGLRGSPESARRDATGIHPLVQQIRELALPGPVHTGEHHDDRKISLPEVRLHFEQLSSKGGGPALVFRPGHRRPFLGGLEQGVRFLEVRDPHRIGWGRAHPSSPQRARLMFTYADSPVTSRTT